MLCGGVYYSIRPASIDSLPCRKSIDLLRPPAPQSVANKPVQYVTEAVRIKEMLGHPKMHIGREFSNMVKIFYQDLAIFNEIKYHCIHQLMPKLPKIVSMRNWKDMLSLNVYFHHVWTTVAILSMVATGSNMKWHFPSVFECFKNINFHSKCHYLKI